MTTVTPALDSYRSYDSQPALSVAIDEVYALRALCAHIAHSFAEDLELASLPVSTQRRMEELLPLLARGFSGENLYRSGKEVRFKDALRRAGVSDTLTESEWARNQGVKL